MSKIIITDIKSMQYAKRALQGRVLIAEEKIKKEFLTLSGIITQLAVPRTFKGSRLLQVALTPLRASLNDLTYKLLGDRFVKTVWYRLFSPVIFQLVSTFLFRGARTTFNKFMK